MKDKELRKALEVSDVIGSAEFPHTEAEWRKERFIGIQRYVLRVDFKLDALLAYLGLEYVARPQPIIQKIKKGE